MTGAREPYTTLAAYNAWANRRVFDACAVLDDGAYRAHRGAFFGSIHRTLNHQLLVDLLFLSRLEGVPPPEGVARLDHELHATFDDLRAARVDTDARLVATVAAIDPATLDRDLAFDGIGGGRYAFRRFEILLTLFNHQTHHRGQVHAMLTAAGAPSLELDVIDWLHGSRSA